MLRPGQPGSNGGKRARRPTIEELQARDRRLALLLAPLVILALVPIVVVVGQAIFGVDWVGLLGGVFRPIGRGIGSAVSYAVEPLALNGPLLLVALTLRFNDTVVRLVGKTFLRYSVALSLVVLGLLPFTFEGLKRLPRGVEGALKVGIPIALGYALIVVVAVMVQSLRYHKAGQMDPEKEPDE
jgi:hypothetical protein